LEAKNLACEPRPKMQRSLIVQLVLLVIFLLLPILVQSQYHLTLLVTVGIYAALSMTFLLLLRTGLITMAIAGFWGVGAYSCTMLMIKLHLSFWLCLPMGIIVAAIFSLAFGAILVRSPGFGFVIMSMILGLLFVVAVGSTEWLGGYTGIVNIPPPSPIEIPGLPPLAFTGNLQYYYLMIVLVVIVIIVLAALYASSTGRAWTAIGLNARLAQSLGIDVYKYRLAAFVIAGAIAGLMGGFYAVYIGCLQPDTFNMFKTIYMHVYAILGSTAFALLGPTVGATIMVMFPEYMRITREIEPIITGFLLIVLVIFLPGGVLSLAGLKPFAKDPIKMIARIGPAIRARSSGQAARDK
jgi:branched-chain amino acid transport system permease protein